MATIRFVRLLTKPTIFTAGVCGTCFCGAAIAQYEMNRKTRTTYSNGWLFNQGMFARSNPFENRKSQQSQWSFRQIRSQVNQWRNRLTTGEKIAWTAISMNFLVFCAWRLRKFQPVMTKFFTCDSTPHKIATLPMILSCFSHIQPIHIGANMYVLYSFANLANSLLGPEQLIGLFLSAGAVSSLTSLACRLAMGSTIPSVGASGALLGIIAYICYTSPDSPLLLLFIPVKAGVAIKCVMCFDFIGLIAKWRVFDHAAHLGGASFGLWYAAKGQELYREYRGDIVQGWIDYKARFK